jgi:hypothetical protein
MATVDQCLTTGLYWSNTPLPSLCLTDHFSLFIQSNSPSHHRTADLFLVLSRLSSSSQWLLSPPLLVGSAIPSPYLPWPHPSASQLPRLWSTTSLYVTRPPLLPSFLAVTSTGSFHCPSHRMFLRHERKMKKLQWNSSHKSHPSKWRGTQPFVMEVSAVNPLTIPLVHSSHSDGLSLLSV